MPQDERKLATPRPDSLPRRFSALVRELAREPHPAGAAAVDAALPPGTVVGRFELVREIGRGGFGVVYEARDRELGRAVALKVVRPGDSADVREERLLREAEAVARLSHPNIVTLYDLGRSEHGPYLVLELLRGQTLARRLEQGPIPVLESLRIAVEVTKAMAHAHASGVAHRDLTPANVFLCEDGQVKVLDLGMAHAFGRRRVVGGTPGYMAPEQREGAPEDERTDVFALGAIIHRMLANELPFRDGAARARPIPLEVPGAPALGALLARMLDPDPVRRPRDAGEVLAPLSAFLLELERTPSAGTLPPPRRRRSPAPRLLALAGAGLAALLGVAWIAATAMGVRMVRTPPARGASIAVLPFVDLSPRKDQEYFSDGLADEILNALARVDGLRVPSRTSSFFFKGKSARLADIGKELNVAAVLEGSVRRDGNRVRVTAQVVNVADGYRVWTRTYDRELGDVFAVQDDIARAVVSSLDPKLLGRGEPTSRSIATANADVYSQYLVGRGEFHRLTRDGFRRAIEAYERALSIDPDYAPAWAALGTPVYLLADQAGTPAAVTAQRDRALDAAERAVALAPDLPDALSTRGYLRALVRYDWRAATADLDRALAIRANDADTHRRYAIVLEAQGRLPEAIAEAKRAVDLDPLGQAWGTLGTLYQAAGELDRAEAAYRRLDAINPGTLPGLVALGRNLLLQGRSKEALARFEGCAEEDYRLWGAAAARYALGDRAASDAALQALVARSGAASPFLVAELHAWRGERDAALTWLERAVADRGSAEAILKTDPFLRSVRGDPRFAAVLRKMNLPAE